MNTRTSQDELRNDSDDARHTISVYVSDMLALERHISEPVARQQGQSDTDRFADARRLIDQIATMSSSHIATLEARLKELGGDAASPLKTGWARIVGAGAAAVDSGRKTKVSKNLRDDHTALSLASISYTMLYATAVGLGDSQTADLAKRHLADVARLIMDIAQCIPTVVLQELAGDGESVRQDAAQVAERELGEVWRTTSRSVHQN